MMIKKENANEPDTMRKKKVYDNNGLFVIYVYPEHLAKATHFISRGISKIIREGGSFGEPKDEDGLKVSKYLTEKIKKREQEINELKDKISSLENKTLKEKIKALFN